MFYDVTTAKLLLYLFSFFYQESEGGHGAGLVNSVKTKIFSRKGFERKFDKISLTNLCCRFDEFFDTSVEQFFIG